MKQYNISYIFIIIAILLQCCKNRQDNSLSKNQTKLDFKSNRDSLSMDEINLLRNGDIIMRHGRGAISLSISAQLDEECKLSHCGILCIDNDSVSIIHTLALAVSSVDGVQKTKIAEFVSDTYENSLVVVRLKNADNSKIATKAKYYLSKKIPFDNDININDTTKFFCSELISHIIASEYGINIIDTASTDKMQNMRFGRFLDTTKFEIIINHQLSK